MRCTSFSVILLCILKCGFVLAVCTVSKHEGGSAYRLQCSNVTLETILKQTTNVSALLVFNSNLRYIAERAFIKYAKHLLFLNIYNCYIYDIHADAFDSLASLRKLSLPSNNITEVKEAWFKDLVYLEQLDLSFNKIEKIAPAIFSRIPLLKRFDIRENRITCLDPSAFPGGVDKIYFLGNPLTLTCRGELTLWMRDHGVNYKTEQSKKEEWLDKLLWLCAMDDASVVKSEDSMKECIILNLFNQLRTGLSTAQSYPLSVDCPVESNLLMACLATGATNGEVIKNLLLYIHKTKSYR
ncbi:leucine-rich repeat transmembrane neuronal protein 1-like [Bombus pascuorum]|uniref:leucine-rich repeat transmembrane neuronal protein 1-like n=1 Tax=Bombus pascuorum TaxID=65598 RepID=UPI00212AB019|nr:leucine-rich repeat transmembrane neuronal protein 1-like [Bombus pascuorum]